MQLSLIIVNYNVRAFLENALLSCRKAMAGIDGEIHVVDNASDDGSVEMIRQKYPDVHLIVNAVNVGFAAGNNAALRLAKGDFIVLINPDTVVQEDTFRIMLNYMRDHPDVGLAGCKILNPDGTLQLACRRSFPTPWVAFTKIIGLSRLFSGSQLFARYNLTYLDPDDSYEVDAISGSFMVVRRAAYEAVGGLDERFFMYGEDLDWCYRIKSAGWKVAYVHETQIIHYKGESARRSDIDEVKLFYAAMRIFVQKHFRQGVLWELVLRSGIAVREWTAFAARLLRSLHATLLDFLLINLSLFLGEYIWFGELFHFPDYAYPVVTIVPWLVIAMTMYSFGVYSSRKLSVTRAMGGVIVGYIVISALTFFFNQYAFSRMVVAISGAISIILLPGWRVVARAVLRSPERHRKSLFGRRTLIVGAEVSGQQVLRKLRARIDDGYDVIGFVDLNRKRVGDRIAGVEILGSIDNIGKVIQDYRATEVIFSTDILSYADILSVIGRTRNRAVNFRLVPSSLEVIIGKTHIDELDDIPLVQIDYNINRFSNRFLKRTIDILGSLLLLLTVYPFVKRNRSAAKLTSLRTNGIMELPRVLRGEMSLVGPPEASVSGTRNGSAASALYLGKAGITGLVHINDRDDLSAEEVEKYNVYYAKNQSLMLDIEILLKSLLLTSRH